MEDFARDHRLGPSPARPNRGAALDSRAPAAYLAVLAVFFHASQPRARSMSEYSSDPGAGVFSLSQIRHLMRVEFGRAQRYGYPLSCLVIGIDRLESLRDLYGYEFRESLLEAVIELLQEETRTCDYLGRLMDDRLMAILPH